LTVELDEFAYPEVPERWPAAGSRDIVALDDLQDDTGTDEHS
jgi:hypothetical protein